MIDIQPINIKVMIHKMATKEFDCNDYIEIAPGVYWVGFADESAGLHCNPYLIVDNGEAVLIDSGSRKDFSTVMLKIMRTGTNPKSIKRLIYQHYDPDLCGNIPHMEAMIDNSDLRIISHRDNNPFINYYSTVSHKECIEDMGFCYEFSSGRRLEFIRTPYCHAPGSFVTYDTATKVLFSSDIFGSYDSYWTFFMEMHKECLNCHSKTICPIAGEQCHLEGVVKFHRKTMPSVKALQYALDQIEVLDISMIAPQHGSIFYSEDSMKAVFERLRSISSAGIDFYLENNTINN